MAGEPAQYTPTVPAGAPSWATAMMRSIVHWVNNKLTGPLRLTAYAGNMRPSAIKFARSLIFDSNDGALMFSDAAGNWDRLVGYASGTAIGTSATLNALAGKVTTAGLTTAAGATQAVTITNNTVVAADMVMASVDNGTNSTGSPVITTATAGSSSIVVTVQNIASAAAFNGTLVVSFIVLKA